jgi:hypothetical protein
VLTFTIDRNNHITALTSTSQAQLNPEAVRFNGVRDLGRLAKRWPGPRLVEIWNALPDHKPVKKFTNRKVAVSRIWAAAQSLAPHRDTAALRHHSCSRLLNSERTPAVRLKRPKRSSGRYERSDRIPDAMMDRSDWNDQFVCVTRSAISIPRATFATSNKNRAATRCISNCSTCRIPAELREWQRFGSR